MFSGCRYVRSFVGVDRLLPRYLMNSLNSLEETCRKYSIAHTDNMIRFWRSKVKGKGHSRPSRWRRYPRRRWGIKVHLLFLLFYLCDVATLILTNRYKLLGFYNNNRKLISLTTYFSYYCFNEHFYHSLQRFFIIVWVTGMPSGVQITYFSDCKSFFGGRRPVPT